MSDLRLISDVAVPLVVWLLMLVVGLELRPADFRQVLIYPKVVAVATLAQLLLLPMICAVLIQVLDPAPHIVAGMILLAACPGGAISNVYTYRARRTVALSVTHVGWIEERSDIRTGYGPEKINARFRLAAGILKSLVTRYCRRDHPVPDA